jgi:hypothetical protein
LVISRIVYLLVIFVVASATFSRQITREFTHDYFDPSAFPIPAGEETLARINLRALQVLFEPRDGAWRERTMHCANLGDAVVAFELIGAPA